MAERFQSLEAFEAFRLTSTAKRLKLIKALSGFDGCLPATFEAFEAFEGCLPATFKAFRPLKLLNLKTLKVAATTFKASKLLKLQ